MLKHVVLAKFKPSVTASDIHRLKKSLASLPGIIPEIREYDFGMDTRQGRSFDFALVATFADTDALDRYIEQPDHAEVAKYLRSLAENLQIVDFTH